MCEPGFGGDRCSVDRDECSVNPCLHGGRCIDRVNAFECRCRPGYTGALCEDDVDECLQYPCANGAMCRQLVEPNQFECRCAAGFIGRFCTENVDECISAPCQNGGECKDRIADVQCRCTSEYFGRFCQYPIALLEQDIDKEENQERGVGVEYSVGGLMAGVDDHRRYQGQVMTSTTLSSSSADGRATAVEQQEMSVRHSEQQQQQQQQLLLIACFGLGIPITVVAVMLSVLWIYRRRKRRRCEEQHHQRLQNAVHASLVGGVCRLNNQPPIEVPPDYGYYFRSRPNSVAAPASEFLKYNNGGGLSSSSAQSDIFFTAAAADGCGAGVTPFCGGVVAVRGTPAHDAAVLHAQLSCRLMVRGPAAGSGRDSVRLANKSMKNARELSDSCSTKDGGYPLLLDCRRYFDGLRLLGTPSPHPPTDSLLTRPLTAVDGELVNMEG